ncbi:MAG: hypothetical protein D6706_17755 [Chloroflexi bacterium]|nr:MAG: hypothetical protein D6706_17755 [Chloroflexota bacterium]
MEKLKRSIVILCTRYLPFGGYRAGSSPNPITSHAYTSQRENMEIGLYYYNARYYAPTLARFLSADTLVPDPANPQSFNRYSYVFNRPTNYSDPSGNCPWCIGALVGAVVGAAADYGYQVHQNMHSGMSLTEALTTDIDVGEIAVAAGAGAVVGGTLGAAAPAVTPYLYSAAATAQTTYVAATAAYPTTAAVVGGVAETAAECAMTGGGCSVADYVIGGATAGLSHRLSQPGSNEAFVGYHGTSSIYEDSIRQGINPPPGGMNYGGSQLGDGFYVALDYDVARYFAENASLNKGGNPIVLEIYARNFERMSGIVVPDKSMWWGRTPDEYLNN